MTLYLDLLFNPSLCCHPTSHQSPSCLVVHKAMPTCLQPEKTFNDKVYINNETTCNRDRYLLSHFGAIQPEQCPSSAENDLCSESVTWSIHVISTMESIKSQLFQTRIIKIRYHDQIKHHKQNTVQKSNYLCSKLTLKV